MKFFNLGNIYIIYTQPFSIFFLTAFLIIFIKKSISTDRGSGKGPLVVDTLRPAATVTLLFYKETGIMLPAYNGCPEFLELEDLQARIQSQKLTDDHIWQKNRICSSQSLYPDTEPGH
jgi:hypothetical protein